MTRAQVLAIVTGAISLLLAIAYLLLVQLFDFRGEMLPAPVSDRPAAPTEALLGWACEEGFSLASAKTAGAPRSGEVERREECESGVGTKPDNNLSDIQTTFF